MKLKIEKIKSIVLFGILVTFSSCIGQTKVESNASQKQGSPLGKIIPELDNSATRIFQDSKNNYWFTSQGVVRYDGHFFIQFTIEDGLYANRVRGIQEDHLGNIYFDTVEGVNKFDGLKIEKLELSEDTSNVWDLEPNDLWFVGKFNKNGVYRYNGIELIYLKLPKHELEGEFYSINPLGSYSPYEVYKTFKDSKGNIWMGTGTFGACRFDGENFLWISEREMTEVDPGPAPGVRSILEDSDGNFWFSSNMDHKYKVIDTRTNILQNKATYQKLEGIDTSKNNDLNNYFMSITQDDTGNIWMARYGGGVWKYDPSAKNNGKKELKHFPILQNEEEVLLFSVSKDRQGDLWLGSQDGGAFKFNGIAFEKFETK